MTKTILVVKKTLYNSSSVGCFGFCFDHNRFWLFGHQTFWLVPITSLSFWRRLLSHSRKNNTRILCQYCLRCSGLKEDDHLILIWYRLVSLDFNSKTICFLTGVSSLFITCFYYTFCLRDILEQHICVFTVRLCMLFFARETLLFADQNFLDYFILFLVV